MGLAHSYVARKRWEANLIGMATIKNLAEALGGGDRQDRVSADAMLRQMGMGF